MTAQDGPDTFGPLRGWIDTPERARLAECAENGCHAHLYVFPDDVRIRAQHGENPEHSMVWPHGDDILQRTTELLDWVKSIHAREHES